MRELVSLPDRKPRAIVAVTRGGYVLARAADDPNRFDQAITGVLALLMRASAGPRTKGPLPP